MKAPGLSKVVRALQRIAPLNRAGSWDNVGLLAEPTTPVAVERVLLTNDLTEAVLAEAVERKANMIVSYHPPIFSPLKRLTRASVKERIILGAVEQRIAIYSPHTALDACPGGINDWLLEGCGTLSKSRVIEPHSEVDPQQAYKVVVFVPRAEVAQLRAALSRVGCGTIGEYSQCAFALDGEGSFQGSDKSNPTVGTAGQLETAAETRLEMVCSRAALGQLAATIRANHSYEEPAFEVYKLEGTPVPETGQGRTGTLATPVTFRELVARVKAHLGLEHVQIAYPDGKRGQDELKVSTVAVCAGSGSSVLRRARADVFLTGEMSHHDILAATAAGTFVILTAHTNTERGYLKVLREKMLAELGGDVELEIGISAQDADPLVFY